MTDQEAEELYKGIMEHLEQHNLSEILNHIEEQIAEGKVVEEEVQTFREDFGVVQQTLPAFGSGKNHLKPSGKSQFSTIVPYTSLAVEHISQSSQYLKCRKTSRSF